MTRLSWRVDPNLPPSVKDNLAHLFETHSTINFIVFSKTSDAYGFETKVYTYYETDSLLPSNCDATPNLGEDYLRVVGGYVLPLHAAMSVYMQDAKKDTMYVAARDII